MVAAVEYMSDSEKFLKQTNTLINKHGKLAYSLPLNPHAEVKIIADMSKIRAKLSRLADGFTPIVMENDEAVSKRMNEIALLLGKYEVRSGG